MRITQAVSLINIRLPITVYRKWALRLKILILYSQKFHRTKFLSFRKRKKPATFLTLPEMALYRPEGALFRFTKFLRWPERFLRGLRGPSYGLPSKWASFRPRGQFVGVGRLVLL